MDKIDLKAEWSEMRGQTAKQWRYLVNVLVPAAWAQWTLPTPAGISRKLIRRSRGKRRAARDATKSKGALPSAVLGLALALASLAGGAAQAVGSSSSSRWDWENRKGYLGALVGTSVPYGEGGGSDASSSLGLTVGAMLTSSAGIGLYGTYSRQRTDSTIFGLESGVRLTTINLAGELNVFLGILRLGADLGVGINSWSAGPGDLQLSGSRTDLIAGPEAAIDIPLGRSGLSVGAEAHYLFMIGDENRDTLQALGSIKVWM